MELFSDRDTYLRLLSNQGCLSGVVQTNMWFCTGGYRGGTGGPDPPSLKNHKNIGFLSNTGPDPLKVTKLPILCHHRPASETPLYGVSLAGQ